MKRRSFVLGAGIAGAAAATGVGFWRWQEIETRVLYPGREVGHRLRDMKPWEWPAPSAEYRTDVAIVGSGIAGLTAAWRLAREGHARFALITGPEPHGNAASGSAMVGHELLRYPTGAHYLPLPSMESTHVRTMLADFGVLEGDIESETPTYDERVLVHAPDERLYRDGRWQEGIVPDSASDPVGKRRGRLADNDPKSGSAIDRFFRMIDTLRDARGADGRKIFTVPIALASTDPRWTALDGVSFSTWLTQEGYDDDALRWYLDYCCRDDYGADTARVSAWSGLHYFASRNGRARNAERGAVLTWPEGLDALATKLDRAAFASDHGTMPLRLDGTALSIRETHDGVDVLCMRMQGRALSTFVVHARRIVSAMPLAVASRVVEALKADRREPSRDAPRVTPWLVANFILERHPDEAEGAPLAWDNVLYGSDGLGYVDSTHQSIRVAPPEATVFTAYRAFGDGDVDAARRWMDRASTAEVADVASEELRTVYGWRLAPCVLRVDVTLRGHAMASPAPGTFADAGLRALRESDGRILYAHADLSGYSVFEEAAWWGWQAAARILGAA